MASEYLDKIGLARYTQKIKQYNDINFAKKVTDGNVVGPSADKITQDNYFTTKKYVDDNGGAELEYWE